MNKRTIITIIMAMCLMLTACGQTENTERNDVTDTGSPQAQEQSSDPGESETEEQSVTSTEADIGTDDRIGA